MPGKRAGMTAVFVCALAIALASPATVRADDLSPLTQNLFSAIQRNDFSAVQLSVANGADISARNQFGMRAVDLAVDKGHFEIAHYLLSLREMESPQEEPPEQAPTPQQAEAQEPQIPETQPELPDVLAESPPPPPAPEWPIGEQNPLIPTLFPEMRVVRLFPEEAWPASR
ncbi:MAG: ankyrin repeat domain-containing protein [Rhodospirillales bacterium]|nr:ankyrin repeat domain-containing protein [Rhodospirillales bacterium]